MLASLYLSFHPLLSQGCFQNSSQTGIAFLSFPLTCWELLNRNRAPDHHHHSFFPFLFRSISFYFFPMACLFDLESCWKASAQWSVTLHQHPCLLSLTRAQVVAVDQAHTSLYLSWNELHWVERLCLNLVMLAAFTSRYFGRNPAVTRMSYSV